MQSKATLRSLILLLCALLTPGMAARADAPTLVPLQAGAAPTVSRYDAGRVHTADAAPVTHTFLLRNDGTTPLTISRFQPSCDCTTAEFVPDRSLPTTLKPGEQAAVRVSITVDPYLNGTLEKSVGVFTLGQDSPQVTLTLDAALQPPVVFSPPTLDFGSVQAGHARSLFLTATVDIAFAPPGPPFAIAASDPDIGVAPLGASPGPTPGTRAYAYRVTLSRAAALGPVRDVLRFARSARAPSVSGLTLADSPGVSVTGTVRGLATATPSALAFGVVPLGQPAVLRVTLSAGGGYALDAVRLAAGPNVRLGWGPESAGARTLMVTLVGAVPGSFRSQVTVTLANGQRLRLPITAYVAAP